MVILAGKIDGPTTTLALFQYTFNTKQEKYEIDPNPAYKKDFPLEKYKQNLSEMIDDFFNDCPDEKENIESVCFGVAGPLEVDDKEQGKSSRIKRPDFGLETSIFSEKSFSQKLPYDLPVSFINDMEAIGYSIFLGNEEHLEELNKINLELDPQAPRSLMLVSGGLGKALWLWDDQEKEFIPKSSEGGHRDFSVSSTDDMDLWKYWSERNDNKQISWEFFLSSSGLIKIYKCLKKENEPELEHIKIAIEKLDRDEGNKSLTISEISSLIVAEVFGNSEQPNLLCLKTIETFISLWASEAGNIALDYLPKGGLYIGGTILPVDWFKDENLKRIFMERFTTKGENAGLANHGIPVMVYQEEDIVLRGAARFAARFIAENKLFIMSSK
ncbi:glucokinase [Microcystis aeruginosa]|jgi:glucokinase|uniref:glucokinase n=1 Tax=Microcystis aeruginosa TaxID=1126 RepID=UPI00046AC904|nr:glucokinase [Microcystis aeruginosa]MDB9395713.1 glucokinase [Microcystis aeruginosa CS-573]NCS00729.1 glucokinase [Microcystis aeruginosa G13-11]